MSRGLDDKEINELGSAYYGQLVSWYKDRFSICAEDGTYIFMLDDKRKRCKNLKELKNVVLALISYDGGVEWE